MWNPNQKEADKEMAAQQEAALENMAMRANAPMPHSPETLLELSNKIMEPESKSSIPTLNKDFTVRFITKQEQYSLSSELQFIETFRLHMANIGYDPLLEKGVAKPIVSKPFYFLNLSGSVNGAERKAQTTQTLRFEKENQKRSWLK